MEERRNPHIEGGDQAARSYQSLAGGLGRTPEAKGPPSILESVPPEVIAAVDAYVEQLRAQGVQDGLPLRKALIEEYRDSGRYGDELIVRQYMNVVNEKYNLPPMN